MINTKQELLQKIEVCSEQINDKFSGKGGKRSIVICGGTGCLSSDAQAILEKFQELISAKGIDAKVSVNQVGCFGFCSQGPFVKIFPEDTLYRGVQVADVEEIVEKDLLNGEIVERLLYVDPVTKEKIQKQDEITFYKKQVRVALHGCGVINPENIEEALGYGAYKGLLRALSMTQQEVIDEVLAAGLRGRGGR